jgi:hypothetical protein
MGKNRYAGREVENNDFFPADAVQAAITTSNVLRPDWFLTGGAFVFWGSESGEQFDQTGTPRG